ncbi:cell division protein FtsQ [Anaerobacillus alkalidiazotrophicus]|uniref:Cell division protein DivIB n=1 Tax=Anaerobacillus alkalidiazotrophicus TaxID=472963 RepID=A0A1S2M199_9BACI|nr:cell division protein FtsQ/DivIB [Anaerobacillus alkalidiazotrophicus]OIJ17747.1 cell division protein FtsQ [Anaerobacillus alkalidiazotrophicus]
MDEKNVITLEDRIPKLKELRRQRANRRLIFYLSIFFILLLTVIYFQSPLSDVKVIVVEGNRYVSDKEIISISGLNDRTSFWGIDKQKIVGDLTRLNEINEIKVNRKFPSTILIKVKEHTRVAYLAVDGNFFPILDTGKILEDAINHFPSDAPLLIGFNTEGGLSEMAAELSVLPESIIQRISEIYYTPVENDPLRISLYMNDGFNVSSTIRHFSKKITAYPAIVRELDPNNKGVIHMRMNPYFEQFDIGEEEGIEG